ncbi:hypothetical protein ZEAMMB73_Zm00001d041379 [Zea mays]|jgi:hypothetical protein|uniref:Uncharacterized protein n=1 Tax=Zea mays TaxID=4577 RepID=A0A1D6MVP8_MAIZE|nr:hypothetical protein ZEAMMB73_Zm00001d041379 [Zea mays]
MMFSPSYPVGNRCCQRRLVMEGSGLARDLSSSNRGDCLLHGEGEVQRGGHTTRGENEPAHVTIDVGRLPRVWHDRCGVLDCGLHGFMCVFYLELEGGETGARDEGGHGAEASGSTGGSTRRVCLNRVRGTVKREVGAAGRCGEDFEEERNRRVADALAADMPSTIASLVRVLQSATSREARVGALMLAESLLRNAVPGAWAMVEDSEELVPLKGPVMRRKVGLDRLDVAAGCSALPPSRRARAEMVQLGAWGRT